MAVISGSFVHEPHVQLCDKEFTVVKNWAGSVSLWQAWPMPTAVIDSTPDRRLWVALWSFFVLCSCQDKTAPLSHAAVSESLSAFETPELGGADDPNRKLGAVVDWAPIYAAAHKKAPILGYLHAGELLPRSENSHENDQCIRGWFQVAPRGYMCAEKSVTEDLSHPTLKAMGLTANLGAQLPYTYARTSKVTALFNRNDAAGVELSGRLAKSTTMAVVGSWTAPDETNEPQRLGLLMDGHFVRADDLKPAETSSFVGVKLDSETNLPLAFVVRRGVRSWKMDGSNAIKTAELGYHERLDLTGRYRTVVGERFWAAKDGRWVRHQDVTVIRRRHQLPEFANEGQKWIDISIITGTAVAYEGSVPVFATLVSVGRDRIGDPKTSASTAQGTFRVVKKQITQRVSESNDVPLHDAPWALELESGQWLYAAPHHDRFGIEHTDGNVEVSPHDGHFLWTWSTPTMPAGWHGMVVDPAETSTIVDIRK